MTQRIHVLTPGHCYGLDPLEPGPYQELQFIQKEQRDGEFVTVENGTTSETVLRVLIHRLNHLQAKASCRENSIAITHLETALLWLEKQTADRTARGVEGTPQA